MSPEAVAWLRRFFGLATLFLTVLYPASALGAEGEPELLQLYQYKPIYFLMGNPYTKIELSFKTQIVRDVPVYFAYTQLMMWDLFIHSPYFYDLNYNPEIFYRLSTSSAGDRWFDLGVYEHESNGLGGDNERSWNRTYLRYHTRTRLGERAELIWDLKAWVPWVVSPNNSDTTQFRGSWEITVTATNLLGPFFELNDLALRLYPGGASTTNPFLGGQELTIRAKTAWRSFLPLFVAQIFHGYAENLLDLREERWGFRAGVGF